LVVAALASRLPTEIAVSSITCYELYTGVKKCAQPQRVRVKVETFLQTVNRIEFGVAAAMEAAAIRAHLESNGLMIGPYDVLLAGQARTLGLVMVTANVAEFSRIPGLAIENWEVS
jgi:tRNA(fMet)-specific endonuclease VapC